MLDENKIAPDQGLLNCPNQIQAWFMLLDPVGVPRRLDDADCCQQFMDDQNFYVDNLNLRRYPFSGLGLPIELELNTPSDNFRFEKVRLAPDYDDFGVVMRIGLDGWP